MLRFEGVVGILQDTLDEELKIIGYYSECTTPNIQHFFIADMIKKGHFVMTTNFDFLIEYALQQSGVPDNEIIPVISKKDFGKFQDPNEQFRLGKKTLYKIHGSTKNIIKDEETKKSFALTYYFYALILVIIIILIYILFAGKRKKRVKEKSQSVDNKDLQTQKGTATQPAQIPKQRLCSKCGNQLNIIKINTIYYCKQCQKYE